MCLNSGGTLLLQVICNKALSLLQLSCNNARLDSPGNFMLGWFEMRDKQIKNISYSGNGVGDAGGGGNEVIGDEGARFVAQSNVPAASLTPAEFAAGLALTAQERMAEGLPDIPPPRTVKELQAWVAIHRASANLDGKSGGSGQLVQPPRNVTRQPMAIDISTNDDFCIEAYEV